MNSIIVGTAGHIDHGKTTLIKALTGHDTDTLAEEKKRGISINLGFTSFKLPSGRTLGIVDVPGHEKFIKNMLAGAAGMDIALIVIAANEGIMPQTQEHIDILSYLDIQKSIIVLTKIDMTDEDFKELVIEDIKDSIQGTFLEGTKIIEVDSVSRRGLDTLAAELENLSTNLHKRSITKKPRMNIDRIFSVKGYGTVVTGTLMEGSLKIDDELMIYPKGITTKVRNLQVHDENVDAAYAGQRTAINLSNVSVEELKRGNTAAAKDCVYVTDIIDVRFKIVSNTNLEMGKYYKLKLYVGSSEEVVRFVPLTHKKVKAGDEGYAQILLDQKIAVLKGDRFVLRTISPVTTIGGGIITDPNPIRYKKITEDVIRLVKAKDSASEAEVMEAYISNHPFCNYENIAAFLNKENPDSELKELEQQGTVLRLDTLYVHMEYIAYFQYILEQMLDEYHRQHTLRSGIPKAECMEKLELSDKKKFEYLLQYFITKDIIKIEQNVISLYNFSPSLTEKQLIIKNEIEVKVLDSEYSMLTLKELTESIKEKQQVMEFLIPDTFVLLSGQYIMHRTLYNKAKETAERILNNEGLLKLSYFRDSIGASRKYALLILEKFDQEKFTKRQGEDRVLYK